MREWIGAGLALSVSGVSLTSAASAGPDSLVGKWRIERVRGAEIADAPKALFEVAPDGRVSTTVGCNRMAGKASVDGDRVSFGAMASTRMACPPPLDRLETRYAAALAAVRSWRIEGTKLLLIGDDGETVEAALARAE